MNYQKIDDAIGFGLNIFTVLLMAIFLSGCIGYYQPIPVEVQKDDYNARQRAIAGWWPMWRTWEYKCDYNRNPYPHTDCARVEKRYYLEFSVPHPGPMPSHCWEKPGWPSCQLWLSQKNMYDAAREAERKR
ncbi:MAG: hypothetical protein HYV52_01995 [Parcubacteria group bacterium]|nr:hypothetical protein [Parcubacteria group bacterium]